MSLNGIDISSYQASLNAGTIAGDFVIIKATEGTSYVNPTCDKHYQQAIKAGDLVGVYHFARNSVNSAKAEAAFFVKNVKGYIKRAVFILDWEDDTSDVAWAKAWLDEVYRLTGVRPMIYMSESVVNSRNWSSVVGGNYGLWVAKYRDMATDYNYNMALAGTPPSVKWWKGYAMWQWTSSGRLDGYNGDLDCNVFYGDAVAWSKYAGGTPTSKVKSAVKKVVAVVKKAVKPKAKGVYVVKQGDTLGAIAKRNGTTAGHLASINGIKNPNLIFVGQHIQLGKAPKTYKVKQGDTLSGIAAKYHTTYQSLAAYNGIKNPNVIGAGQVIRIP